MYESTQEEIVACLKLIRWHGFSLRKKYHVIDKLGSFCTALNWGVQQWDGSFLS